MIDATNLNKLHVNTRFNMQFQYVFSTDEC